MNNFSGSGKNGLFLRVKTEMLRHAPFTAGGAVSGIILMFIFSKISSGSTLNIFYVLHPGHVLRLSE